MRAFYQIFQDIASLRKAPYTRAQKYAAFLTILKLYFLKAFIKRKSGVQAKVLGFTVFAYDTKTLFFLFREIFIHSDYTFRNNTGNIVIVDGGANIGFATLFFKWINPECTIHAFEPDEDAFALLEKNVKTNNLSNVHLYKKALATHDDGLDFFIDPNNAGSLKMSTLENRMPKQKVHVASIDFAAFLKNTKVNFAKIDIEGAEEAVLTHMSERNILGSIPLLKIEYHHNINDIPSRLSKTLSVLEQNNFTYSIEATGTANNTPQSYQDLLIHAEYRSTQ